MTNVTSDTVELARRFAEETDAIALHGAAPDCAERMAAFHAWFDAECTRLKDADAALAAGHPDESETDRH